MVKHCKSSQGSWSPVQRSLSFFASNSLLLTISAGSLLGFTLAFLASTGSPLHSLAFGLRSFLSVFLAGILGREVDPNHHLTSVLASVGQVIIVSVLWTPHLLLTLWAVLLFRVMNRASVYSLGVVDTVFATALTIWLGHRLSWVIAGAGGIVFFGGVILGRPQMRSLFAGSLSAAWAVYLLVSDGIPWPGFINYPVKLGLISIISATYLWGIYNEKDLGPGEDGQVSPSEGRVRLVQLVALGVGILYPLWTGSHGFHQIATFWSVIASASLANALSFL